LALPSPTLTFSSAFLAEDAGFYKKEGLKVSTVTIVGVGSANAVIAGSAFTSSSMRTRVVSGDRRRTSAIVLPAALGYKRPPPVRGIAGSPDLTTTSG